MYKFKTAGVAIEALEQLLEIEKEEAEGREEKFKGKIEELQGLLRHFLFFFYFYFLYSDNPASAQWHGRGPTRRPGPA